MPETDAKFNEVRSNILAECKKNNIQFLNSSSPNPKNPSYVLN